MIDHELWRIVAGGFLTQLIADLAAVTDRDARRLLIDQGAFMGKLHRAVYDSLGYVPERGKVQELWDYIQERHYNPQFDQSAVPLVVDASIDGTTLQAGTQPDGYTVNVYSWDFVEFTLVGPLTENSQPGAGYYVLTLVGDDGRVGLPSSYLEIA